ncbi:hypothetical protein NUM3379_17300 [Kineococcus sp. NUM-3379]
MPQLRAEDPSATTPAGQAPSEVPTGVPAEDLRALARAAADLCAAPAAVVTVLVDGSPVPAAWTGSEVPASRLAALAATTGTAFVVDGDTSVRRCAAVPVTTADGAVLGSLCVLGGTPGALPAGRVGRLHDLAGVAASLLESARHLADSATAAAEARDETRRARAAFEEELRRSSLRDALTGLPNRALLLDRVGHALASAGRDDTRLALLSCDLDGLREVNESAGHAAGDELLREVTGRLQRILRPGDTVARLGGDEFAMLCPDITDEFHARAVADRIVAALAEPFHLRGGAHLLGVSVGLALSGRDTTAGQLLAEADDAMYGAKRAGRGRSHLFDVEVRAAATRASVLLAEAAAGLERGEFVLYGQPVVDIVTGRTTAVETLIRWEHPERGLLFPGAFLETVEHSWLMVPLGRWVLDTSCRMAAGWLETLGPDAPSVHVNVSGRQLETGTFAADVESALDRWSLPGRNLVVELTETHVAVIDDALRADLERLRARGVKLAVDDLGTGYSALTSITELPVDVLKVDRSFVRDIAEDPSAAAVVRAVIGIGGALGLSVVAEGVETAGQQDFLRRHGCDSAQGFLWSPARPDAELVELLRAQRAVPSPAARAAHPA